WSIHRISLAIGDAVSEDHPAFEPLVVREDEARVDPLDLIETNPRPARRACAHQEHLWPRWCRWIVVTPSIRNKQRVELMLNFVEGHAGLEVSLEPSAIFGVGQERAQRGLRAAAEEHRENGGNADARGRHECSMP